jgi:hypothetical protein
MVVVGLIDFNSPNPSEMGSTGDHFSSENDVTKPGQALS